MIYIFVIPAKAGIQKTNELKIAINL